MTQETVQQTDTQSRPSMPQRFTESMETVGQNNIFIVNADEFASLVDVEKDEAGELPNGLYLIGDTALDRVQEAGVDSDKLTRAVLEGVSGFASSIEDHPDDPEALQAEQVSVSRVYSAHHVFLGSMKLELAGRPIDEPGIMIMVKPHIENGGASQKPFRELGNLGLMQDMEMPGVYRPVGILKSDKVKYVMTEFRPGVTTLSDRHWYGKRGTGTQRRKMTYEEQTASREEDAEVVVASCEMLGEIHAQGIFHGDAQAKNIGWARMPLSEVTKPSVKVGDEEALQMTILDVENATVFEMADGDFPDEYYERLAELATKDVRHFVASVPRLSRLPMSEAAPDFQGTPAFIQAYIRGFIKKRAELFGGTEFNEEQQTILEQKITEAVADLIKPKPHRLTRLERRQQARRKI